MKNTGKGIKKPPEDLRIQQIFADLKYRSLFENSGNGMVIIDADGIYHLVNLKASQYLGGTPENIIGKSIFDFLPPQKAHKYFERIKKLIKSGDTEEYEDTFDLRDGTKTFLITDKVLKDSSGNGYALLSCSMDITEHRKAENALHESEQKYRLLAQNLPGITVLLFDNSLNLTLAEGYLHPEFGLTTTQMEGKNIIESINIDQYKFLIPLCEKALNGITTSELITSFSGRYFSIKVSPLRNNKNEIIGGMIVYQDITEKKKAEEELTTNYSLLRMAGQTAKFGGWSLNLSDMKVTWSDEVASIHEISPGYHPLLGEGIGFYAPEWRDTIQKLVLDCKDKGIPYDAELEIITAKENRIWVRVTGEAIYDESGKIIRIQGSIQNIDERKAIEKELEKSALELQELNATKDKFFSIIAHDLKTPFNSIIGFSSLLSQAIEERKFTEIEKYVEIIQNSSQQAFELLVNLLEWSKSQTGKLIFTPIETNINEAIEKSIKLLRNDADQKNITIAIDTPSVITAQVDQAMLNTILRNLLSNAIKFTKAGGKISISAHLDAKQLEVSVIDNGIGISKKACENLFKIDRSHTTLGTCNEKGTGLGLILCKEFVDKHGGEIRVESQIDRGSRFIFTIPQTE